MYINTLILICYCLSNYSLNGGYPIWRKMYNSCEDFFEEASIVGALCKIYTKEIIKMESFKVSPN